MFYDASFYINTLNCKIIFMIIRKETFVSQKLIKQYGR